MEHTKKCLACGKIFAKYDGPEDLIKKRYCSRECAAHAPVSVEGRRKSSENLLLYKKNETKEQALTRGRKAVAAREANGNWTPPMTGRKGNECPHWLGEKAGYSAKHRWILNNWKKTGKCEMCFITVRSEKKTRLKHLTHWHNLDNKYNRVRSDWVELCPKCHRGLHKH